MAPRLSIVIAAIDRERQMRCALTSYLHWDRGLFDLWVMDDSGTDRIVSLCQEFRSALDLHLVRFHKPANYWRGPENAYSVGLELATGHFKVITQEAVLVPSDLPEILLRYVDGGNPIVNVHCTGAHEPGRCGRPICNWPGQLGLEKMFLAGPVTAEELVALHPIPHDHTDHPNFYGATAEVWERLGTAFPRADRPYGDTDGVLLNKRLALGLPRLVPMDLGVAQLGCFDRSEDASLRMFNWGMPDAGCSYSVLW